MGSDCTIPIDDGLLNIRVGAIICRGNEFLMMENVNRLNNFTVILIDIKKAAFKGSLFCLSAVY